MGFGLGAGSSAWKAMSVRSLVHTASDAVEAPAVAVRGLGKAAKKMRALDRNFSFEGGKKLSRLQKKRLGEILGLGETRTAALKKAVGAGEAHSAVELQWMGGGHITRMLLKPPALTIRSQYLHTLLQPPTAVSSSLPTAVYF